MSGKSKSKSKTKNVITVDINNKSKSNKIPMEIYTDGSCSRNGRAGAIGGIGIYFPNGELPSISKIFPLDGCTNQRTELYAILSALRYVKSNFDLNLYTIHIKTDSEYSINCVTKWVHGWIKNDWIKQDGNPVLNKELIETIYKYIKAYHIILTHVSGPHWKIRS